MIVSRENGDLVDTYPDIFESATFILRIKKYSHPHVANSNQICLSTAIRNVSGFNLVLRTPQGDRGKRACAMKPSAAILRKELDLDLVSTQFWIPSGFKNIHFGEFFKKVPDLPANSPDMCEQKAYLERKKLQIQKYLNMCGRGLNPKKIVVVQNRCQKWEERDEISENVNLRPLTFR